MHVIIILLIIFAVFEITKYIYCKVCFNNYSYFSSTPTNYILDKSGKNIYVEPNQEYLIGKTHINGDLEWDYDSLSGPINKYALIIAKFYDQGQYSIYKSKMIQITRTKYTNLDIVSMASGLFVKIDKPLYYYIKFLNDKAYDMELKTNKDLSVIRADYSSCIRSYNKLGYNKRKILDMCSSTL